MYAWVYILHMFRGLVFTSIASNAVPLFFLHCLRIFRSFLIIVLGVILVYLYRHLCKACLKKKTNYHVSTISSNICILKYLIIRINCILNTNL
jgi:positive regulator of sigma E activity